MGVMRSAGWIGLVAVGFLWAGSASAATPQTSANLPNSQTDLSDGDQVFQPNLGRALSQLADLYLARRIDAATVDRLFVEYEDLLRNAGPDAIIAVSQPKTGGEVVNDAPDGARVLKLYSRAAAYGYRGALIGLGDLYSRGELVAHDPTKAFAAYTKAANQGVVAGQLRVAELLIRGEGTQRDVAAGAANLRSVGGSDNPGVLEQLADLCLSGRVRSRGDRCCRASQGRSSWLDKRAGQAGRPLLFRNGPGD